MTQTAIKNFLSEPLLHFLVLGLAIFALDAKLDYSKEDPKNIIIDDARISELTQIFEEGQGRTPSTKEIESMIITWTQNEIFYREGLAMGLDKGDDMIRNRMVLKVRNVIFNNAIVENPSEQELQEFFELNRAAYDLPALYDFEQLLLSGIDDQVSAEAMTTANQEALEAYNKTLRNYESRPATNITSLFGDVDAQRLFDSTVNQWVAVNSRMGWHLVRITRIYPAQTRTLDQSRSAVVRDWKKMANDFQLAQQSAEIAKKYQLRLELSQALEQHLNLPTDASQGFSDSASAQAHGRLQVAQP